jgi:hypothetical protein
MPTHSVARLISDKLTSRGCTTFSSHMLVMVPRRTSMPAKWSPALCLLRSSVTNAMGFIPAFSARVYGIISRAYEAQGGETSGQDKTGGGGARGDDREGTSAKARAQYALTPDRVLLHWVRRRAHSASPAPPPAIIYLHIDKGGIEMGRDEQVDRCISACVCVWCVRHTSS